MKKYLVFVFWLTLPMATWAASFNPGLVAGRYTNGATATASGVITTHGPALLVGCEFYNGNTSARTLQIFDSATVPADATGGWTTSATNGWKVDLTCPATSQCFWGNNGPNTSPQGATGIVFNNGISWANSQTVQIKTIGSADSTIACSWQN
jgi:hypothetical protein